MSCGLPYLVPEGPDAALGAPPCETASPPAPGLERDLIRVYREMGRAQQELRHRVQHLARCHPESRAARALLAEWCESCGELTQAADEYRALGEVAGVNERRRCEEGLRRCEPPADYLTPSFLGYLNTEQFGRPEHRTYLLRDLDRGRQLVRLLRQWMPIRGKRFLDVGSSHGGTVMALAECGAEAVGIEIDSRRSQLGRDRVRELGFEIEWHTGDVCDPDLIAALGKFDGIVCQDVLEHVMDPRRAIEHISNLLQPGGAVYFVVPNKYAAEVILADHHFSLMGITLLARPQGVEYFEHATGISAAHYETGYYRTEKFYRQAFARCGVMLESVEKYPTVDHVFWYAPVMSALAARLGEPIAPGLRPELAARIRRRARKVIELYVHGSRVLKALEGDPATLAMACHLIVSRLCTGVWRFVGTKSQISQAGLNTQCASGGARELA